MFFLLCRHAVPHNKAHTILCVLSGETFVVVPVNEIVYVQSNDNYIRVYTVCSNKPYLIRMTLRQLEAAVGAYDFLQIHKQFIVAIAYIAEFNTEQTRLKTKNGEWLPIGRAYAASLFSHFFFLK